MTKHDKDTHPKLALKKIIERGLTSPARMVLCVLWIHSNKSGESYPSIDLLSKETLLNKRTIYRCISELRESGVIFVHENPKGKTNLYKFRTKKSNGDTESPHGDTQSPYDDTQSPIKGDTQSLGCDTESPDGCHSVTGRVTHSRSIYKEEHPNELPSEHPIYHQGKEKRKKETSPKPKIRDYERTFDELWDEVRDRPFLHQMAYITKGHPAVHDRFKGIIISAVEHVAYHIIKDHKEDCLKRIKEGQTLNDWDEGILRGEWYFKGLFLEHYQHRQNAEHLILGEPIPEESKVFMPYYEMAFDEFINRCRNLFSQYQEKALDPQWAPFCHRYGDGPWITRKYTRS